MSFDVNLKPKKWTVLSCAGDWGLQPGDELKLEGTSAAVKIERIRLGTTVSWAESCTHTDLGSGKEQVTGTSKLEHGGNSFVITYTDIEPGKDKLDCASSTTSRLPGSLLLVNRLLVTGLRYVAGVLNRVADNLVPEGQPGGWTAEEGSSAPRVLFEPRVYARRRA
jgi:hypothetical protein